jgi:hypothetical protein
MKQIALFLGVAAIGIFAITWFAGGAPASDRTQLAQVNIQALMQNAHDLTDTTPEVLF